MPKNSIGDSITVALISGIEKVWIRGGGGVSRFSVEKFLSHSPQRTVGNPLLLHYYRVPKKIGEEGGGIKILRRKI